MQQLHIKNIFQLFIPLGGGDAGGFAFTQTTVPSFGLTLTKQDTNESCHYQLELITIDESGRESKSEGLAWAKRSPYRFQTKENSSIIEGVIFQCKVVPGVFDFRRVKQRLIRFNVNCYSAGVLLNQATSAMYQLLPKRRVAEEDAEDEVVVPVVWMQNDVSSVAASSEEPSPHHQAIYSSPYDEDEDSVMALNTSQDDSFENTKDEKYFERLDHYQRDRGSMVAFHIEGDQDGALVHPVRYDQDTQYMVLYNGNAEVVGNFRALNFYKASDINIKEDIHLLNQDRNPRDVLMKIDGVEYKFKQGVRGNNDTNRRFVGYIAQQIESVVPQAVQLIDGILHVDYESLIPYLSESIKQNFNDINSLNSKTDQIHQVVDMLYNEFMKKEGKKSSSTGDNRHNNTSAYEGFDDVREYRPRKKPWKWIFGTSMAVLLIISIAVGVFFVWPFINSRDQPTGPNTPYPVVTSPSAPAQPINPIITPPPLTAGQLRDLAALQDFYDKTNGRRWLESRNWLSNTSVCAWQHVVCNEDGRVIELNFIANGVTGSIPASIAGLEQLQVLAIELSPLDGSIPDAITTFQHLKHLSLTGAALQGTVPAGIFSLPELQTVMLEGNQFSAWELPSGIKYSKNLTNVMLDGCNIVGTVPEELGALRNLILLQLPNNNLHGTLPSFEATPLEVIDLGRNFIGGSFPRFPATLQDLILKANNFTGRLPDLADLPNLSKLDLSENKFSGQFELAREVMASIRYLDISLNLFDSVSLSTAPNVTDLSYCDASMNDFSCPIPLWVKRCNGDCE